MGCTVYRYKADPGRMLIMSLIFTYFKNLTCTVYFLDYNSVTLSVKLYK